MAPRVDLLPVVEGIQVLAPSPRVNITAPEPDVRTAAQYETLGPHRKRMCEPGRTGVSELPATTVASAPKRTNARAEVGFVIIITSPPLGTKVFADVDDEATVTVTAGANGEFAPDDIVKSPRINQRVRR